MESSFDLAIVGAGIIGLATAFAAAVRGKRVVVIDRNATAVGASIRNFGFVTVTGQQRGDHWRRALRTRDVWHGIAAKAKIDILHRGLVLLARRPEAASVLEAFANTEMGEACQFLSRSQASEIIPSLRVDDTSALLYSPYEIRVESRHAVPQLAAWLEDQFDIKIIRSASVLSVAPPRIATSIGEICANAAIVCPGNDFSALFPERFAAAGLRSCTLQMLRIMPAQPTHFHAAVMSDLSFIRYDGYAGLAEAAQLRIRLAKEQAAELNAGVHLIAVQSADGSLVVGDSHVSGDTPEPFASEAVDELILNELDRVVDLPNRRIVERWSGSYAIQDEGVVFVDRPDDNIRILIVTGGTGASTCFALGEEVIADLYENKPMVTEENA